MKTDKSIYLERGLKNRKGENMRKPNRYYKTKDEQFTEKLEQARSDAYYGKKLVTWYYEGWEYLTFSDGFTERVCRV